MSDAYGRPAEYVIRLFNSSGDSRCLERSLPPHATHFESLAELFPGAAAFLAPSGIGVASVESRSDLAVIQLTRHLRSGAVGAEHFMVTNTYHEGKNYKCCGA
jgi:hypothetical protein